MLESEGPLKGCARIWKSIAGLGSYSLCNTREYEDEVNRTISFYFSMIRFSYSQGVHEQKRGGIAGKMFESYSLLDSAALNRKEQPGAIRMLLDLKSHLKM